jgi:hypothetical protein
MKKKAKEQAFFRLASSRNGLRLVTTTVVAAIVISTVTVTVATMATRVAITPEVKSASAGQANCIGVERRRNEIREAVHRLTNVQCQARARSTGQADGCETSAEGPEVTGIDRATTADNLQCLEARLTMTMPVVTVVTVTIAIAVTIVILITVIVIR